MMVNLKMHFSLLFMLKLIITKKEKCALLMQIYPYYKPEKNIVVVLACFSVHTFRKVFIGEIFH